eukprot:CAMPEP_0118700044 /NCGR_PEP_ID=MMETSP0800-20121206/16307_1 /TAXON_ID=210618 ORGANISM="Striatella unipunctata, Strain CCMP2910" /NCGR_SAMPLE_ID=MMETSP0800 /ASSEMBLY_ACC=CAM_ASM_000638 /LENGTH=44 /DNA_ID= /DNA_START= /DNA_END= /DNA_ORIENTATION=
MKELDLLDNWIGDDEVIALADALKTNQYLLTLDLRYNKIGFQGA